MTQGAWRRTRGCSAGSSRSTRCGSGLDAEWELAAARVGLAELALSGCSTTTDHHYVFPAGAGDLLEAEIDAARELGMRFHPCRGSMDLGRVGRRAAARRARRGHRRRRSPGPRRPSRAFHDPSPGSMLRIAVAPCSPFSVTERLMRESAELARRLGVRMHTHLAETLDEERHCLERFGRRPLELMDEWGWVGDDVWFAHGVHLDEKDVRRCAETGTGVAWCPSSNLRLGSGIAPGRALLDEGAPTGLGVDGSASNDAGRPARRGAAGDARLARGGRRAGAHGPRGAARRHARRRRGARPRRRRLARAGHARGHRAVPGRRARDGRRRRGPGGRARALRRRRGCGTCSSRAVRSCATAGSCAPTRTRSRARAIASAAGSRREPPDEHARRRARPRRRRRVRPPRRRRPEGEGRVRLRQRPVARGHAVGRHAPEPAPARADPLDRHRGRGGEPGRPRRAHGRRRPGQEDVRARVRRPARPRVGPGPVRGRARRDRRGRDTRARAPRGSSASRSTTRSCRRSPTWSARSTPTRRGSTSGATSCGTSRIEHGDPDAEAEVWVEGYYETGDAGPGAARPRGRARDPGRGRRGRPHRHHAVAPRRPPADRARA